MALPQFHHLRDAARKSLASAQSPKKVILLHTGVVLLISLLLTLLDYLLEKQIGNTGGLSGIDTRAALETARSVLQLARSIALPFWQMGYLFYTLNIAQGSDTGFSGLLQGFRCFRSILRLKIMMALILFLVTMASSYLSSAIFMLTPWSAPLMNALTPMFSGEIDDASLLSIYESIPLSSIVAMMGLFLICLFALVIPVYYRYRMADLWLMDHPNAGALLALRSSRKMMKGNALALFKVDLHFWWFFVLGILISLVGYADLLLAQFGITLPIDKTVASFLFFAVYLALQLALYLWKQNEVSVTYAHAYEALKPSETDLPSDSQ